MAEKPREPGPIESAGADPWRVRYARSMADTREGHLEESEWERLACGEVSPAERERALEHVTRCSLCADLYRGLTQLTEEARLFDPGAPRASRAGRSPLWERAPGWARWAAAAAAIAVGVLPWLPRKAPVSSPTTRAPAAPSSLVLLEPSGTIGTLRQFRWRGVAEAETYRVRLFREDGLLLWTSGVLAVSAADWPETLDLPPGRYFWEVEAFRDGKSLARSELLPFVRSP